MARFHFRPEMIFAVNYAELPLHGAGWRALASVHALPESPDNRTIAPVFVSVIIDGHPTYKSRPNLDEQGMAYVKHRPASGLYDRAAKCRMKQLTPGALARIQKLPSFPGSFFSASRASRRQPVTLLFKTLAVVCNI
jgi:hypothetical protein